MVKATVSSNISISKYAEENRECHQINGSNISSIIELVTEQYLGPHTPKLQCSHLEVEEKQHVHGTFDCANTSQLQFPTFPSFIFFIFYYFNYFGRIYAC